MGATPSAHLGQRGAGDAEELAYQLHLGLALKQQEEEAGRRGVSHRRALPSLVPFPFSHLVDEDQPHPGKEEQRQGGRAAESGKDDAEQEAGGNLEEATRAHGGLGVHPQGPDKDAANGEGADESDGDEGEAQVSEWSVTDLEASRLRPCPAWQVAYS